MAEDEILKRLDAHLERSNDHMQLGNEHMERGNELMARSNEHMQRGNEYMQRGNEHMERGNELMAELREEMRLSRQDHADLRRFIHEQNLRAERVTDRQVKALDGLILKVDEGIASLRDMRLEMADVRDESRAHTQAILKLVDRL